MPTILRPSQKKAKMTFDTAMRNEPVVIGKAPLNVVHDHQIHKIRGYQKHCYTMRTHSQIKTTKDSQLTYPQNAFVHRMTSENIIMHSISFFTFQKNELPALRPFKYM